MRDAGLVILEVPKTGTQALRVLLRKQAEVGYGGASRHIGITWYQRRFAPALAAELGRVPETVAVVRAPLDRLASWHRYLQRDQAAGRPRSTRGISFDDFARAAVLPDPPEFARIGRIDRMVGWDGTRAAVDHLFDYERLDLLMTFLRPHLRPGRVMPERNLSPRSAPQTLSPETEALVRQHFAPEFALYAAVSAEGYLRRA